MNQSEEVLLLSQNRADVDKLLAQYLDVVQASDLPTETKQEAVAEIAHLGLEVHKPRPVAQRLDDYLARVRQLTAGITAGTGLYEALETAARTNPPGPPPHHPGFVVTPTKSSAPRPASTSD